MTEREIYDGVVVDGTADFLSVVEGLHQHAAAWCVIDNFAVNAYTTPVYTAQLDLVVAPAGLAVVLQSLRETGFKVRSSLGSTLVRRRFGPFVQGTYPLTIRLVAAECYQLFLARTTVRAVLGHEVPVAALEDTVQGKLWNLADPLRRPSERMRDRFNLMRLAQEHFDEVVPLLPEELRITAAADRARHLKIGDNGWGDDDRGEP